MRLLALIKEPASIARYLAALGEATEVPRRSPGRCATSFAPLSWRGRVSGLDRVWRVPPKAPEPAREDVG